MSYPRKLHILVIEDETDVVAAYKISFELLAKSFPLVTPVFARSYNDARKHIDGDEIFHVVILDLNLPLATREKADDTLAPGEQLLEVLANRDSFPVPVVLIVSGKLGLTDLGGLQDRLETDFWHGRLVNKGTEQQDRDIEEGLEQALKYVDVGIHIRDAGKEWFPTVSPREEDLLRRCVLSQASGLGLDIRWWCAESGQSTSHASPNRGPTKVMMGHFLLDDGLGISLPTFFKLEPAGNGPSVCRDIGILAQKLGHIKVFHTSHSRQRSLIVSQSATNRGVPISLNDYLHCDPSAVSSKIPRLISQIVEQLNHLGDLTEDEVPASEFIWEWLDRSAIEKTWNSCDTQKLLTNGFESPVAAYDHLKASDTKHWATRRSCSHGDLNSTNVAIDASNPNDPQAYIFDAAGMKPDFEFRDLATLEVTTILFNSVGIDDQLIQACHAFYQTEFLPVRKPVAGSNDHLTENILTMILAIRSLFKTDLQKTAYALMVFDAVLRQLSGLGFQPSPNKVKNPLHACYLAAWIPAWLNQISSGIYPAPIQIDSNGSELGTGQILRP